MNSLELLNEYAQLSAQAMEKNAMLDIYREQLFERDYSQMSNDEYRELCNQTFKEINKLEEDAKKAFEKYLSAARKEAKQRAAESIGLSESASIKK